MHSLRLLKAKVWHRRDKPTLNEFTYRVFYVSYDLDESTEPSPALLSFDRWNAMSVCARDHGARNGSDLLTWAYETFRAAGVSVDADERIELITHPRVLGYVFNPISFYLLLRANGALKAVICEVSNTFGDNHNYVLAHEDLRPIAASDVFTADKALYVSPFTTMHGGYTFSFTRSDTRFTADIVYLKDGEVVLRTAVAGSYTPCTSWSILLTYLTHPLMTVMVIARIHWQALKLFFKRVPHTLHERPAATAGASTRGYAKRT